MHYISFSIFNNVIIYIFLCKLLLLISRLSFKNEILRNQLNKNNGENLNKMLDEYSIRKEEFETYIQIFQQKD